MHAAPDVDPRDLPPPKTADEVQAEFGMPLVTFAATEHLEEFGVSTVRYGSVLHSVAPSHTLWRNPADRDDPVNLADLTPELRASLETEPRPLPEWLISARERMRFPMIWEAVRTSRVGHETLEETLLDHVHHVVMNTFREERVRGGFPGELTGRATEKAIEHGIPIALDGTDRPGLRLDTDPHVLGLALDLGDRHLTAAIPRDHLALIPLEFATRR